MKDVYACVNLVVKKVKMLLSGKKDILKDLLKLENLIQYLSVYLTTKLYYNEIYYSLFPVKKKFLLIN